MTPEQTTQTLADLLSKGQWLPLLMIFAGLFGRLLKQDIAWFPTISPRYRAWAVLAFGILEGVLGKVVSGVGWRAALIAGFLAAMGAISGHELVIEGLRSGREIGDKSGRGGRGGATSALPLIAFVFGVALPVTA